MRDVLTKVEQIERVPPTIISDPRVNNLSEQVQHLQVAMQRLEITQGNSLLQFSQSVQKLQESFVQITGEKIQEVAALKGGIQE